MKMNKTPFVELRDVNLTYGRGAERLAALDQLTLSIAQGEFVAVVGPSGCGKSTLMKLVTGLLLPTGGTILIGGKQVTRPVESVGMAFQNSTLLPWRTTLANVMLPFEIVHPHKRRLRANRKEYIDQAQQLLTAVGLGKFADRFPWQLSGGMQQRANLCRALIHGPRLLMLDEPFGALDAFTREELWGVMQNLWLAKRFTAILVTHDLREAAYLSDVVYVMCQRPGRIIYNSKVDLALLGVPALRPAPGPAPPDVILIVLDCFSVLSRINVPFRNVPLERQRVVPWPRTCGPIARKVESLGRNSINST